MKKKDLPPKEEFQIKPNMSNNESDISSSSCLQVYAQILKATVVTC